MEKIIIGGKCPVCGDDRMIHLISDDDNIYQFDGCSKCGFGYGSTPATDDLSETDFVLGPSAWIFHARNLLFKTDKKLLSKVKKYNRTDLRSKIHKIINDLPKSNEDLLNNRENIFQYRKEDIDEYKDSPEYKILK